MRSAELAADRRVTREFVAAGARWLILARATPERTASGGVRYGGPATPLRPQLFRLEPQTAGTAGVTDAFGTQRTREYVLLGAPTADVAAGDTFTADGELFRVDNVLGDRSRQTWAEVTRDG